MVAVLRFAVSLVVFAASYLFFYWVPGSLVPVLRELRWLASAVSILAGLGVAWLVWSRLKSVRAGLATSVFLGAAILGSAAFAAGFFGPILFRPEANQGPLLGLFITGPAGAILGAMGGAIWWLIRERAKRAA